MVAPFPNVDTQPIHNTHSWAEEYNPPNQRNRIFNISKLVFPNSPNFNIPKLDLVDLPNFNISKLDSPNLPIFNT